MIPGCVLTPSNNFTGTIVVSSVFSPSVNIFTSISNKTTKQTSTAKAAAIHLDVVSSNGAKHHMGPPLMPKVAVFSR